MYRGEDVAAIVSPLLTGRLDAVWGSRRLSLKDIEASYRLRYKHNAVLGSMSYVGSHMLSAAYLVLFGRYISDTFSGVRGGSSVVPDRSCRCRRTTNSRISICCRRFSREKADVLETPVQFLALSPERVRRTTPVEGLRSLALIAWQRIDSKQAAAGACHRPRPI